MGLLRRLKSLRPAERRLRALQQRADAARDRGSFAEAADCYEALIGLAPDQIDMQIQCAHMLKEAGRMDRARHHYLAAARARPEDADLALQIGHFHKTVGRIDMAAESYRRALALKPGWSEAEREIEAIPASGDERIEDAVAVASGLAAALVPEAGADQPHLKGIALRRLGRLEDGPWGVRRTLRGIEAIHGYCIDDRRIIQLRLVLDGEIVLSAPLEDAVRIDGAAYKSTFNAWMDLSGIAHGLHFAQLQLVDAEGGMRSHRDYVVIAEPIREDERPDSDAVVSPLDGDPRPIEEQIRNRPSMIRPAARSLFPGGVRSVLVLRTDQLGDLVASIPALRRLRTLLPDARIVGLLTTANADLARTLGLFDEQIAIDFPHDFELRRRIMPIAQQEELKARLARYRFDVAIDLAPSDMSRPLLALTGAAFLHGFAASESPALDGRLSFDTCDAFLGTDRAPHAAKPLALVEALGAALATHAPVIRRDDLDEERLQRFGIAPGARFIVLHGGARLAFSRWPHFAALARELLARTDCIVVMMLTDDDGSALPDDLVSMMRLRVVKGEIDFDAFDALLSFARLVIANDSGPKHLAALRGTPVITLFSARINWAEWGQENIGWIISRRVPCAGCAIFHEPEECGKGFACIRDIRVEEVMETALVALA